MSCPPPCPKPVKPSCGGHRKSHDEPACRVKPVMKGLHWAQTQRIVGQALALSLLGGICVYTFLGRARKKKYKEYYETAELEDWADEMARKGLFQAIPSTSLKDFQFCRAQS